MEAIVGRFRHLFSDKTGKCKGDPIKIQLKPDATPTIQPPRRVPLHYRDRLEKEIQEMLKQDIIEGPLEIEEPGTCISNLVITDKKGSDRI